MPKGVYARNPVLRPQTFRDCEQCHNMFGPLPRLSVRFCSKACKVSSQAGKSTAKAGKKYPELNRARVGECLTCGAEYRATADFDGRRQLYCSHRCYLHNRRVSHFESAVMDHLVSRGVPIERSVRVGRWTFDGRATGTTIIVEADGDYWHSSEVVRERDSRKNVWCAANGLDLFRVTESEFRSDPARACDVTVKRWENFTGKQAVRSSDSELLTGDKCVEVTKN